MPSFKLGSKGSEVTKIQARLRTLGLYRGPLDATFGGGTDAAVRVFQRQRGLEPDGVVGPLTWKALFNRLSIPRPVFLDQPLNHRCLALTAVFETDSGVPECFSGLSGDFDGQGISFGVLQWNIGQGSLQPLLERMDQEHSDVFERAFNQNTAVLRAVLESSHDEQMDWARSIQDRLRHTVAEPWRGQLKTLGRSEEFQAIQVEAAEDHFKTARAWCEAFGVRSQRALALMFDIRTQNGSIGNLVKAQIFADFARIPTDRNGQAEVDKLCIIANRRADASNPRWIEDVRRRKLTIAKGSGIVHGNPIDLEEQFGITMADAVAPVVRPIKAVRPAREKAFARGRARSRGGLRVR
jgi:hypothetical protein